MRISAAVAVLALTVAFVAACGGSALDPVASAATKTGSGSMHVTMDSSVKTGTVGIALTGEGDFDNAAHTGSLHLTITMNFSDFGEPVSVSVPSASQTFDATNESIPGIRD